MSDDTQMLQYIKAMRFSRPSQYIRTYFKPTEGLDYAQQLSDFLTGTIERSIVVMGEAPMIEEIVIPTCDVSSQVIRLIIGNMTHYYRIVRSQSIAQPSTTVQPPPNLQPIVQPPVAQPTTTPTTVNKPLEKMTIKELRDRAAELGIKGRSALKTKDDLIRALKSA